MMTDTLKDRVQARIDVLGTNATEVSRLAGFDPGFVRDILRDKKSGVQGRNLERLAFALQCQPAYLTGEQDFPEHHPDFKQVEPVWVMGEAAVGRWLDERARNDAGQTGDLSPLPPDPRWLGGQFDWIVRDSSVNKFAQIGQRVRLLSPEIYAQSLVVGDLVGISRIGDAGWERSIRQFQLGPDGKPTLIFYSNDPTWNDHLVVDTRFRLAGGEKFQLDGLVLFAYDAPHPQNAPIRIKFYS